MKRLAREEIIRELDICAELLEEEGLGSFARELDRITADLEDGAPVNVCLDRVLDVAEQLEDVSDIVAKKKKKEEEEEEKEASFRPWSRYRRYLDRYSKKEDEDEEEEREAFYWPRRSRYRYSDLSPYRSRAYWDRFSEEEEEEKEEKRKKRREALLRYLSRRRLQRGYRLGQELPDEYEPPEPPPEPSPEFDYEPPPRRRRPPEPIPEYEYEPPEPEYEPRGIYRHRASRFRRF